LGLPCVFGTVPDGRYIIVVPESPPGIPTQIRRARESQGLTWYALAKAVA
jgi:hypothetical protein